jgi:hypothetical protein
MSKSEVKKDLGRVLRGRITKKSGRIRHSTARKNQRYELAKF